MNVRQLASLTAVTLLAVACSSTSASDDAGTDLHEAGPHTDGGASDASADLPLPTGKFRIAMWCGPPGDQMTQARIDQAAKAGFTTVSVGCSGPFAADYNAKELQYAEKDGLGVLLTDSRISAAIAGTNVDANLQGVVADFSKSKALDGYYLADEPSTGAFANLAAIKGALDTLDPAHFGYINLLPSYASTAQLGTASYDDYVSQFLTVVKPKLVSWDYYPFYSNGTDGSTFHSDMETVRAHAVATKTPFFQFIQSISYNGHRATTQAEKLWQATQTMAYGGAGVSYFTYWTPPQASENFGTALIDPSGNETSQYAEATAINARLSAFGKYLSVATSTGIFHDGVLPGGTSPRPAFAHAYLPNTLPFAVGTFSVNDGHDEYVFLANRDYTKPADTDVYLSTTDRAPESLDVATGTFEPMQVLVTDARGTKVHVTVAAGDGALIHLHGPVPAGAPGAEAFIMTVRADAGTFDVVDSSFGDLTISTRGWSDPCPTGYVSGGRDLQSNGFSLCVRSDLLARTFYIGNVVADAGHFYASTQGVVTPQGTAGWGTCPTGSKEIGRRFESNGFWMCLN